MFLGNMSKFYVEMPPQSLTQDISHKGRGWYMPEPYRKLGSVKLLMCHVKLLIMQEGVSYLKFMVLILKLRSLFVLSVMEK